MPKHPITPTYDKALRYIADLLPVPEVQYRRPQKGSEILAATPGMRDQKGQPVDPKQRYLVGSPQAATNHLRQLRKAYERGGQPAVVKYLQPYRDALPKEVFPQPTEN
jgi:hypothetical protein